MAKSQSVSKVAPQAKEVEDAILGTIMLHRYSFETVNELLKPECFYNTANQKVYKACKSLATKNQSIDILTVVEELKKANDLEAVGGQYYVTQLTNSVVDSYGIEGKCKIVLEKFIQRELIKISNEIHAAAYDTTLDVFDVLQQAEEKIFEVSNSHNSNDYTNLQTGLVKAIQKIENLRVQDQHVTGVYSGYSGLDFITHGWQPTDLIILAARPSVGKTAFALNLARNAALNPERQTNVGFFSLEMSSGQLINRLLSCQSEIYLDSLLTGRLDDSGMKDLYKLGVVPLGKAQIFIDDTAGLNMYQLKSKARRMVSKNKVGLIIIDYLQLMTGDIKRNGNREQEISQISREMKKLAKDLNVPIIALSQLSRKIEERSNKVPQLSDLRESGAIEQDADIVGFLYRPEEEDLKNTGMLTIKKHRNGSLEDIAFKVDNAIQKWTELKTEYVDWKPSTKSIG